MAKPKTFTPRRPDFSLRAKINGEENGHWATVGAGWSIDAGIRIHLNTGVTLRWDDNLILGLFRNEPKDE
jgi:hypothetical protein